MSFLKHLQRLLGNSGNPAESEDAPAQEYKGYLITPAPIQNGDLYRVAARIVKGDQQHQLIRADEMADRQACIELTLRKAQMLIDQQGDRLFDAPG